MHESTNDLRAPSQIVSLALAVAISCAAQVPVYTATTVAGYGGPQSTASLGGAAGLAVDSSGNLYVSDGKAMVYKLTPAGTFSIVAGGGPSSPFLGDGGPATSAELIEPTGLAVDNSGNLYIADTLDNRIRKVSSTGTISTIAGGTSGPLGDGGPATSAVLSQPQALALDSAGNLFVADTGHNRIRMIALNGTITTVAGDGISCAASGVCAPAAFGDGGPAVNAAVTAPVAIAVDTMDDLYITDPVGFVREVKNGVIQTIAGTGSLYYYGDGGPATAAGLYLNPQGVAIVSSGTIYISDSHHFVVRAVTPDGKINTIAGNYVTSVKGETSPGVAPNTPALSAYMYPEALAIAPNGNIYVASAGGGVLALARGSGSVFPAPAVATDVGVAAFEASSFGGGVPLAPIALGGWVEIYGNNLAPDTRTWAASDFNGSNAPTVLDGTSVTIGGQPAYVSYISPGQVNVQAPTGIGTGAQPLVISTAHGTSPTYAVTVQAEVLGLLAPPVFNIGGTQYGVAVFPDGVTYALPTGAISGVPSRPAQPGDTLTFYGIGFGPTSPNIPAGEITPSVNSLAEKLTVSFVTAVGPTGTVQYAGLAPGIVGLYQFNVVVPNLPAGGAQSVFFSLAGVGQASVIIATK